MENKIKEISEKLNIATARQSVYEHLILCLFDVAQDKEKITKRFIKFTDETYKLSANSSRPKEFLSSFQETKKTILELLADR